MTLGYNLLMKRYGVVIFQNEYEKLVTHARSEGRRRKID